MSLNPVISLLGRKLRLAVIGGGAGSFIGSMHRQAARIDDRYELVAGVLSSDPEKALKYGLEIGIKKERIYSNALELIKKEASLENGADVISIMTPNNSHFEYAYEALKYGFNVICDKPMTNTLENAEKLHNKVKETGLIFCLTHNYTGYPMVRQAKAMIEDGQLGTIRLIQVEYVQGGKADENDPTPVGKVPWRYNPDLSGPSLVMGDIGTHAHNLVRFISGLEINEAAADAGAVVPGRKVQDYTGALLRFNNGARGIFWVTQAAAGVENCLQIRISGTKGTIEWMQECPQVLTFKPLNSPVEKRTPNGPDTLALAKRSCRMVAGHPEGFHEGFANLYSDAAEVIAAKISGTEADPLARYFPDSYDGLMGVRFVHKIIESSNANGKWIKC